MTAIGKLAHPENLGREHDGYGEIVSTDRLEKFVNNTFHWRGLTSSDQKKMAAEILRLRRTVASLDIRMVGE
tara:strand:+ start:324 stop:539 length:216 start_codon:yes stop_codon:yes gene_type:complete